MKPLLKDKINILMIIFFVLLGCSAKTDSPVYKVNGKNYGVIDGVFRSRFWHYYERGLSYSEGKFFKEAVADFDQAIALREQDQRRARTYGMHFVDYFPNREKGIILFEMGKFDEAKENLEKSIKQFPSAKADFYLDRVREQLLKSDKNLKSYPEIVLNVNNLSAKNTLSPKDTAIIQDKIWTKDDPFILKGDIRDSSYISNININGLPIFQEHSSRHISLNHPLELEQGEHELIIQAKNLIGLESQKAVTVHVDREGPLLVINSIIHDSNKKIITMSARMFDEIGIADINVERKDDSKQLYKSNFDKTANNQSVTELNFNFKIPDYTDKIVVTASDRLDNKTTARLSLHSMKINKAENIGMITEKNTGCFSSKGVLIADAGSAKGLLNNIFESKPDDKSPPVLSITDWEEPQTVYLEKVYIDGEVSDDQEIKSLTVNGVEKLRRPAAHIFFNHLVKLKSGENKIIVSAVDTQGNTVSRELTIVRNIAEAFKSSKRLSISVMPFENKGEVPESILGFQDTVVDGLVEQNRFNMVERSKLDAVLAEQKLSNEAVFDQADAIKIGKLLAARSILTGTIIGTRKGIEIAARMIDTESSEIVASKDVYGESMELSAVRELAQGLAVKFHQEFPLVSGMVIQNKEGALMLDLGNPIVKPNRRVIVFREEPVIHPATGKTLGVDNIILGYAKIDQVMDSMSKANMVELPKSEAKALDKVVTE